MKLKTLNLPLKTTPIHWAIALSLGLAIAGASVTAQAAPKDQIKKAVETSLGASGVEVLEVNKLEYFADLYEVVMKYQGSKQIVYSNASGSHLILGDLMDGKTMQSLTQDRMALLNAIDFDKDLPLDLALKSVYGNGSRKVAIFEDPNCGYCKTFRRESVAQLQDTTVYTFVYPVLGQDSVQKASSVLCASDPTAMWDNWMLKSIAPQGQADCNPPIQKLRELGQAFGVTGTPTVFFADGTRVNGKVPPQVLLRRIAEAESKARATR